MFIEVDPLSVQRGMTVVSTISIVNIPLLRVPAWTRQFELTFFTIWLWFCVAWGSVWEYLHYFNIQIRFLNFLEDISSSFSYTTQFSQTKPKSSEITISLLLTSIRLLLIVKKNRKLRRFLTIVFKEEGYQELNIWFNSLVTILRIIINSSMQ